MGCSGSSNNKIEDDKSHKILLLGIGGVGKSTVFKQLKLLYTSGLTFEEAVEARRLIANQLVKVLIASISFGSKNGILLLSKELEACFEFFDETIPPRFDFKDKDLIAQISTKVSFAWAIEDLKKSFQLLRSQSNNFEEMSDSLLLEFGDYFLNKSEIIFNETFAITHEDIIKLRRETIGAQKMYFNYDNARMQMIDFGGQSHERMDWVEEFKNSIAVIYMVSLADYDGEIHSSGETKTNRLLNAFEVYKQLTENNDLKSIPFIVLLNKYDLFEKKIKNISIQIAFPEIENKFCHDAAYCNDKIAKMFIDVKRSVPTNIYVTNATDTHLIKNVFKLIADGVLNKNMISMGLEALQYNV